MNKTLINSPSHYIIKVKNSDETLECIDVIEGLKLGYRLGNVLKYLWRSGKKQYSTGSQSTKADALQDLLKARWYLQREIAYLEKAVDSYATGRP